MSGPQGPGPPGRPAGSPVWDACSVGATAGVFRFVAVPAARRLVVAIVISTVAGDFWCGLPAAWLV